jgi:hypothetical protein
VPRTKEETPDKVPVPFPDDPGAVYMTESQWQQFQEKLGKSCALYWCEQADRYAEEWPIRWRRYKDHYRTLLNWHIRKVSDGYDWFEHPKHGPGYYRTWLIRDSEAGR